MSHLTDKNRRRFGRKSRRVCVCLREEATLISRLIIALKICYIFSSDHLQFVPFYYRSRELDVRNFGFMFKLPHYDVKNS